MACPQGAVWMDVKPLSSLIGCDCGHHLDGMAVDFV